MEREVFDVDVSIISMCDCDAEYIQYKSFYWVVGGSHRNTYDLFFYIQEKTMFA